MFQGEFSFFSGSLIYSKHVFPGSDAPCLNIGGTCQDDHLHCSGAYQSGLCSGATHRRCCTSHSSSGVFLFTWKKSYFSAIKPILILHYLKKYGIFRIAGTDSGMCSNVKVYSRASWGARAPKSVTTMHTPASLFFVHHTEGNFCHDFTSCATQLRGIQNYHMDTRGNSLITI